MPSRNLKRKQRHHSEPPPSRPSADSGTESDDELEGENAERGGADSAKKQGLQNQNNAHASIASKARAALDSHLRSSSSIMSTGSSSKRGRTTAAATTATAVPSTTNSGSAVSFPLTPTSAGGEAAPSSTVTAPSTGGGAVEDKMDEDTIVQTHHPHPPHPHPHPPPDSNSNKNDGSSSTRSSSSSYSHHRHHHHHHHHPHPHPHHPRGHLNGSASSVSAVPSTMSHRVENQLIRPRSHFQDQQQHFHDVHSHYYSAHPSPPPIATLTHSPSLSSDRSSVNSPAPTVLPPLNHHPSQFQAQPYRYTASSAAQPGAYHHSHYYPSTVSPPEVFATPAAQTYGHAYGGGYVSAPPPPTHVPFHHTADMSMSPSQYSVNPYATTGSLYGPGGHAAGGGSGGFQPVYTDDASTKLSDRVRRRCFNCCTTDTSTWRRSSLNPGKVLCNKCGLFERTHSRPRPDQFPHKRAPLQIPTQNVTHDASAQHQQQQQQQQNSNSTQSSQSTHSSSGSPHNLPPTTGHPSLGATYSHPSALPQIQEWLRPGSNSAASGGGAVGAGPGPGPGAGSPSGSSSASAGPSSSRAHSASSAGGDHRHHPYSSASSIPAPGTASASASASASAGAAAAGAIRSPQGHSARLAKRSGSVNSDLATTTTTTTTPPPSSRGAGTQNLTPSPSPPPIGAEGTTSSTQESSPRVASQSASAGAAAAESGN